MTGAVRLFKFLLLCLSRKKRLFGAALLTVVVYNLLEVLFPKLMQLYIDSVAGNELVLWDRFNLDILGTPRGRLLYIPLILLIFGAVRWLVSYIRAVIEIRLAQGALFDLRSRIFNTMQNLSFAYHDTSHGGTLISNVVEDVNHAGRFFQTGIFPIMEVLTYLVIIYICMFRICAKAAAASLALLALGPFALYFFFKYGHRIYAATKELFASTVRIFTENMEGHLVVRAFGCGPAQLKTYSDEAKRLHKSIYREVLVGAIQNQAFVWATVFGIPVALGVAFLEMQKGTVSLTQGELFMLFYYQSYMVNRIRMLCRGFDLSMRLHVTAERLGALFEADEYLDDSGTNPLPGQGPSSVEIKNLSFGYNTRSMALQDISLQINAGETVGLVGSTGSGKTTLALLLSRFYDPSSGQILLDGRDIRDFPLREIRNQFSLVFQESFLFSASIKDNIGYGRPGAGFEEIVNAASLAQAHDFIMGFPDGYNTVVGERGVTLSGGQRQRISIARAILRKPRFLVLDACTSAVDTVTEKAIQSSLQTLRETSTVIIIAQRYSSIAHADRIFVLDDGRLLESGKPEDLNRPGTVFHRIMKSYRSQNG